MRCLLYSSDDAFHGGIISPAFPADGGLVLCFLQLDSTREPVLKKGSKEAGSSGKGATGSVKQISAFTYHRLIK
jgi:hypothetical protein